MQAAPATGPHVSHNLEPSMSQSLLAALRLLDPNNANHWTSDGAARLETVKLLANGATVTREQLNAVAPGLSRGDLSMLYPQQVNTAAAAPAQAAQAPSEGGSGTADPIVAPAAGEVASQGAGDGTGETGGTGGGADAQEVPVEQGAQTLADAHAQLRAAQDAHAKTGRAVAEASAALDRLLEADAGSQPDSPLADAVSSYHASQHKIRNERAARREALKGVNLQDILPSRSRIDDAMARKTQRGMSRPTKI